ncbi:C4-dicarboxylate TRAP transporter large permease protein DctM [Ascidiaceihabitans donghaensis]|uniref:C4-dicarboxylate TRAP transporter large permease protein DctM n=1 Tax=Ascidiaceihabitans donghaensis TaxID=1510460 RepID=A0A2R8BFW0_9RHOB|nr:TRAP transporter large permease subunit [Ascidiaceihabitans donghaensis]SPH22009.1 C4-dicarboxylate TRAP transporter large permease protein DctM [Ascidiaceihabitans donghaensis]
MDIGTISLILMVALIALLAIGMPLGFASAVLAVLVLVLRFEPDLILAPWTFGDGMLTAKPGSGALNLLQNKIYGLLTDYVLISIPLFIFMAALLERSGVAKTMYDSLSMWLNRTRGGIAIVTSIMAVIMAAMSGIIGGEVVLLGLIALPQMLRLGYNQNLAIGVICASGSLGTMIPPSIVLIIYGLITETSIKALFTASFLPGFMLASFIILYIVIRTQLRPEDAPLPDPEPDDPVGREKAGLFLALLNLLVVAGTALLCLRAGYIEFSGQNAANDGDAYSLASLWHFYMLGTLSLISLAAVFFVFGKDRSARSWALGKGLVPPIIVIGVVLGSIYGGITGITEAAGMGALAVFMIAVLLHYTTQEWIDLVRSRASRIAMTVGFVIALCIFIPMVFFPTTELVGEIRFAILFVAIFGAILRIEEMRDLLWDALVRTLKSTGTIIWVTIGAAALAGAYTVAGGPNYIANLIIGADLPTMGIILTMMLILLFMGAFMDWVGIVLLIIPVFLPIVLRLPIEEIGVFGQLEPQHVAIWFGVVFCMNMQVSFLSPPFGPAAFYLKSVAPPHISLTDIFKGFLPFIAIQLCALTVLLLYPPIIAILL